jgi:hypothetical protein
MWEPKPIKAKDIEEKRVPLFQELLKIQGTARPPKKNVVKSMWEKFKDFFSWGSKPKPKLKTPAATPVRSASATPPADVETQPQAPEEGVGPQTTETPPVQSPEKRDGL